MRKLPIIKRGIEVGKLSDKPLDEKTLTPYKAMKYLCQRSEKSGLDEDFWADAEINKALKCVHSILQLNDSQIVLFSVISAFTIGNDYATMQQLGSQMSISPFTLYEMQSDLDDLIAKRYVEYGRCEFGNNVGFAVNKTILKNIRDNKKNVMPPPIKLENNLDFIHYISQCIKKNGCNANIIDKIINDVCSGNNSIDFISRIEDKELTFKERCIMFILLDALIISGNTISSNDINKILARGSSPEMDVRRYIMNGKSKLVSLKYLEVRPSHFDNDIIIRATYKAISDLLPKEKNRIKKVTFDDESYDSKCTILKPKDIYKKELVYDDKTEGQIQMLRDILSEKGINNVQANLKKIGLRSGINVLLYGIPGTGKTETVLQLCKESKREVMQVNISDMKSFWFGRSEQIVNELFENYDKIVSSHRKTPVLLFNEADGILSKRKQLNNDNGCGQTENSIQNILLQHFEDSKGIIICTTNMITNLDEAFNRRFLYKIEFSRPDIHTKAALVKMKLGQYLTNEECMSIATNYQITGGTLDNILTKIVARQCLYNTLPTFNDIKTFCSQDVMDTAVSPIGF